jgi:hypothetical protein
MAMSALIKHRLSALLATGFVGAALVVAGCGGATGKSTHASAHHSTPTTRSSHSAPPASASSGATSGIPQGNGGDQDPDNNGGPSDGDGNI